jgi:hypothetical protein
MLDGKRYYAEFPDEGPAQRKSKLHSPILFAALHALEKELRPYIRKLLQDEAHRGRASAD